MNNVPDSDLFDDGDVPAFEPTLADWEEYSAWANGLEQDHLRRRYNEHWLADTLMDMAADDLAADMHINQLCADWDRQQAMMESAWLPRWAVELFGFRYGGK